MRQRARSTAGMGKAGDRGESPSLQSLQPDLSRVWTPPPPCYSLVSIATGRAALNLHIHLHPFYLHNSTDSVHIHETMNEGDSPSPCSKPGWGAPWLAVPSHGSRLNFAGPDLSLPDPAKSIPAHPAPQTLPLYFPTSGPFLR